MGLPNELTLPMKCESCGKEIVCWIQFNFGARIETPYVIGSRIDWNGPNAVGQVGLKRVEVPGIGCSCPGCYEQPAGTSEFNIIVENDTIMKAEPFHGTREFMGADYTVLER